MLEIDRLFHALPAFAIDLSLRLAAGETGVLLGASGSGKTSLLRLIAGFLKAERGSISLAGRRIDGLPPEKRDVGIVFQGDALFPTMNVRANVEYGPRMAGVPRRKRRLEVEGLAATLGLSGLLDRMPRKLSGGERQRVALARTLAAKPSLLLFDEALSSLDPDSRRSLAREIRARSADAGIASLHVSHDVGEALEMADRIFVMDRGQIIETGSPRQLFERPARLGTARFFGAGPLLRVTGGDGELWHTAAGRFTRRSRDGSSDAGRELPLQLFFPAHLARRVGAEEAGYPDRIVVEVLDAIYHGSRTGIVSMIAGTGIECRFEIDSLEGAKPGTSLVLAIDPEIVSVLDR